MIYGERIRLRAIERSDLKQFAIWLNDPDVRQGVAHYRPFSVVEEERWFERMLESPADEHPLVIEVQEGKVWQAIGNCGLMLLDWRIRSAEIGIFIGEKQMWDKGYGSEAMALLIKHGFESLNLNRISLRVYETNARAIRSYEKVGFIHEGRLRQAEYQEGRFVDVLLMSLLRSDWKPGE